MSKPSRISYKEVELEIDRTSLITNIDQYQSWSHLPMVGNSREILLFRYPEKKEFRS